MSAVVAHVSLEPLPWEETFSIMCWDAGGSRMTQRAGLDVTFPCSSAGPWVLQVGLHPLVRSTSCPACWRGRSGGMTGPCRRPRPFR